ncbi:putative ribonuclease H-like domain-containing protein [Tanacetum coccineum]
MCVIRYLLKLPVLTAFNSSTNYDMAVLIFLANSIKETKRPTEISQSSGPTTLLADKTVHEESEDSMERAATTADSLDAEQDSGSGPKHQDTILGDRPAQTRFERLSKHSNDLPLSGVNTPRSGEDRLKIMELMGICTKLSDRVLALENVKTAQDLEITSLKNRVKKLEKKKKTRTPQLKRRLFKVRIESSADKKDAETQGRYGHDFEVNTAIAPATTTGVSVSTAEPSTPPTTTTVIEDEDLIIAQTLMKMRSDKSKEKAKERGSKEKYSEPATRPIRGVTMQEPSESRTRKAVPHLQHHPKDKGKAKMIKPEKPLKKKDQIKFDEEVAKRLAEELKAEITIHMMVERKYPLTPEILSRMLSMKLEFDCKFDGKADEGFFIGYSLNIKAFRVFNSRTRIVEEKLHIRFSESTPNVAGRGPDWIFDIDALTRTMNYEPIVAGTQSNGFAGTKASDNADLKCSHDDVSKPSSDDGKKVDEDPRKDSECNDQEKEDNVHSTNNVNATSTNKVNFVGGNTSIELLVDPNMPALEDISIFDFSRSDEDDDVEADINNLDTTIQVSPIPTTRIHKDHPFDKVIGDLLSTTQTRNMSKNLKEHGFVSTIQQRTNHKDLQNCLFACFLSQEEPKKNKNDERGIVIRNKARLVAQGYIQEEGIDYDEVFTLVARIKAIRLFLAYASFKDFVVYQMDVKSAFLYGKIEEEVYVCQPPGFEDLDFPDRVYKVEKALYGLHQAPRAWYETLSTVAKLKLKELCNAFEKLMHEKFQMSSMVELTFFLGLQVQKKKDGIFISQDNYVVEILKKFGFMEVKTASTPMETENPLLKDEDGEEVDVHMYRSMISSLMYLTSSRLDIVFTVFACARYQVNPKVSHLYDVKRIFRYLKGQPKLGLWYPKDSPFDLVACTDSDYVGASLDRKSTTGEAEYVAVSSCCGQVLWI